MSAVQTIKCGSNVSMVVENLLKECKSVLEGLQQAECLRMLSVYGLQSTKMGDGQCENEQVIWGFQKLLCLRF